MTKMGKKDKKRYAKLITKKLESMGIEDKLVYQATGKQKPYYKKDDSGKVIMEDGKPKIFMVDPGMAVNPHRRLLKNLLESTPHAVKAFLNLDTSTTAGLTEALNKAEEPE